MNSSSTEVRGLFVAYNLSTIALIISMTTYSAYLGWWWQSVDPNPYLDYKVWHGYYFGFFIMTVLGIALLVWSFMTLIAFILNRGYISSGVGKYLNYSIFVHWVFVIVPLFVLLVSKVIDAFFIVWMVWTVVNIILGSTLRGLLGTGTTRDALIEVRI